jgi:hypothetical protein
MRSRGWDRSSRMRSRKAEAKKLFPEKGEMRAGGGVGAPPVAAPLPARPSPALSSLLLLLLLLLGGAHPEGGAQQCLQIVDPPSGYVLAAEDHVSMPFILRVNCPGLRAVSHLRLDSEHGGGVDGGGDDWWGPSDLHDMGLADHAGASARLVCANVCCTV